MINLFLKYIENQQLLNANQKVLLAVSGGIDSMVMLHLFTQTDFNFAIVHCNFTLRGEDSNLDEQFIIDYATNHNIKFFTKRFETENYAKENNYSIQIAARELRYKYFEDIRKNEHFDRVAIAHNKNDSIETFFINLLRGSGIHGLTGIQNKKETIIRPLLFAERNEIEIYAKNENIAFREDASNKEEKYLRNKIRHSILTEFQKIDSSYLSKFQESISHLDDVKQVFNEQVLINKSRVLAHENEHIRLKKDELLKLKPLKTFLFEFIKEYGFNASQTKNIIESIDQTGKYFYSKSHRLLIDRNAIIISHIDNIRNADETIEIEKNSCSISTPLHIEFARLSTEKLEIIKNSNFAFIDFHKLKFPLILRKWKKGDWFIPYGMKGTKKISDYLIDLKMNRNDKENVWVMESEQTIIWIVGMRTDDRFKISSKTTEVYKIQLI